MPNPIPDSRLLATPHLLRCPQTLPNAGGSLRVKPVHIPARGNLPPPSATLPRATNLWYMRASSTRAPGYGQALHNYKWGFELEVVKRLREHHLAISASGGKRARTTVLYLGLDGYSIGIATLPKLLRTLNTSSELTGASGMGSVTLTRIGFDESTQRHMPGAKPDVTQGQLAHHRWHVAPGWQTAPDRAALGQVYGRDMVAWGREEHRYGVWHMVRVEIGT